MLIASLPDLRETQSGKTLINIGRMEGRNGGKIEGEIKGKIESLLLVLNSRLGQLDPKLKERIEQISAIEQADRLLLRALEIASIDELTF